MKLFPGMLIAMLVGVVVLNIILYRVANQNPDPVVDSYHTGGEMNAPLPRPVDASSAAGGSLFPALERVALASGEGALSPLASDGAAGERRAPRMCAHCGEPLPLLPIAQSGQVFCCHGCSNAWELIRSAGLDAYYDQRTEFAPRAAGDQGSVFDTPEFVERYVQIQEDGTRAANLQICDLKCHACVWLNEKMMRQAPGVLSAEVSYGTGQVSVTWDPKVTDLTRISQIIRSLGYNPAPLSDTSPVDRSLLIRLGVAGFCSANVMMSHIAVYAGGFSGDMNDKYRHLFEWVSLIVATPAAIYSAAPIHERAWAGLKNRTIVMDVPMSAAILLMFGHGLWATMHGELSYVDSMVMLVFLLLIGQWAVARGRRNAQRHAESGLLSTPATALRKEADGTLVEVAAESLRRGETIVLGGGSRLAADGVVSSGSAFVDLSHMTGESEPRLVTAGVELPAGAHLLDGQVEIEVVQPVSKSAVEQIRRLVAESLNTRAPYVDFITRLSPWFTGAVLAIGALVYVVNALSKGLSGAIEPTVAVLLVSCPCALAVAAPTSFAIGIGAAARRGAFVRKAETLDRVVELTTLALDKTGTLTLSAPRVKSGDDRAVQIAAAIEAGNQHPVAKALAAELRLRKLPLLAAEDVHHEVGRGITGLVEGRRASVKPSAPGLWRVSLDDELLGEIELAQEVRREVGPGLFSRFRRVAILSGDVQAQVDRVAQPLGITEALAGLQPADKARWITDARRDGDRVLYVGDGLNDAPALAAADVSVVMGDGAASALRLADVIVFDASFRPLRALVAAADETRRALRISAVFSALYNTCTISLAAFGYINPLIAAVLMPISSAIVITIALRIENRVARRLA